MNTPDSQWGQDYMVVQDLSKEARDAGEKGPILGNAECRYIEDGRPAQKSEEGSTSTGAPASTDKEESLPF